MLIKKVVLCLYDSMTKVCVLTNPVKASYRQRKISFPAHIQFSHYYDFKLYKFQF